MTYNPTLQYILVLIFVLFPLKALSLPLETVPEIPEKSQPVAHWNFNEEGFSELTNGIVTWNSDHGGVKSIPDTELKGLRFHFKGKGPEGDSSSELRYKITQPSAHLWEHLKIWQPENFYHRLIVKIETEEDLSPKLWKPGDEIISNTGNRAKVAKATQNLLYILYPEDIYSRNWGKSRTITNLSNSETATSKGSRYMPGNNKLSAMWQGKYSNAAIIAGTRPRTGSSDVREGVGYCDLQTSSSAAHGPTAMNRNQLQTSAYPECFSLKDNGSVIELVIERKRASTLNPANGKYSIWKRSQGGEWEHIYQNEAVRAYQAEQNYFDSGYVFGWSNSGFFEDTDFYLLEWGLWESKPSFLP